ncbi:MAG: 3-deoxy-D-manno-octulosonic acid kinase [Gammaproteobacteria bacterium]
MGERTLATERGFILYEDALAGHAGEAWFSAQHWTRQRRLRGGAGGGRGDTWFVTGTDGDWVLRHYRRGGWAAMLSTDYYAWTGLERSRPWREWRLLYSLYKEGLPVPQPLAAQVRRHGFVYRGDLLTRRIPDSRSLASRLQNSGIEGLPWRAIGICLRRFHAAGVQHADLNAHNILLDDRERVFLIDFDKSLRRTPAHAWQRANLRRLWRSLRKLAPSSVIEGTVWDKLREGYGEG